MYPWSVPNRLICSTFPSGACCSLLMAASSTPFVLRSSRTVDLLVSGVVCAAPSNDIVLRTRLLWMTRVCCGTPIMRNGLSARHQFVGRRINCIPGVINSHRMSWPVDKHSRVRFDDRGFAYVLIVMVLLSPLRRGNLIFNTVLP